MPMELFRRFEGAAGVEIIEGYGLTEVTCLVSVNPPIGSKKVGSVGLPLPYTDVKIITQEDGKFKECSVDEIGEISISNPVFLQERPIRKMIKTKTFTTRKVSKNGRFRQKR